MENARSCGLFHLASNIRPAHLFDWFLCSTGLLAGIEIIAWYDCFADLMDCVEMQKNIHMPYVLD